MEISALRVFVKVAELGNLSQSATALGLTQPSVSRIISNLEKAFGGAVFYRTGRGVTLTEIGLSALPRARAIVSQSDQLVIDIRDLVDSPSGLVAIAMLPSLVEDYGGDIFDQVREQYPGVRLRFLEGFSSQIEEWLADGRADLGVLSRYQRRIGTQEQLVSESQLTLVGSADWSSKRRSISFSDLGQYPLILPANPNGLRLAVDDAARRQQVRLNVVAEADSLLAQKKITLRKGCFAILSAQTVANEVHLGLLNSVPLVKPTVPRLVVMATTTQRPLSRAARAITRLVRSVIER